MSSQEETEKTFFRHQVYRPPTKIDPSDGKPYTWKKLAAWYDTKGWTMQQINTYWDDMLMHSIGRTRTRKKEVLDDENPVLKKRKRDAAQGSKWEQW